MINKTLFILLCIAFLFSSCDPAKKYEAEINEIDSSLAVLDTLESQFNGIEFDSLKYMVEHVLRNEDSVKKYYRPDTVSLYIGIRMNESKGIRKTMKNLDSRKKEYGGEIAAMQKQFKDLKADIEEGILKKEDIEKYLAEEKADLEQLNQSFTGFYELQEREKRFYYHAVPTIDSLILALKNEAEQK